MDEANSKATKTLPVHITELLWERFGSLMTGDSPQTWTTEAFPKPMTKILQERFGGLGCAVYFVHRVDVSFVV